MAWIDDDTINFAGINFETYYGGSDLSFAPTDDQAIYFKNFLLRTEKAASYPSAPSKPPPSPKPSPKPQAPSTPPPKNEKGSWSNFGGIQSLQDFGTIRKVSFGNENKAFVDDPDGDTTKVLRVT
jgi:hypothetical protein